MTEAKKLDLSKSVRELCDQYPELAAAMDALGFHDILKPGMLATAGRFVTIPMGAKMKGLGMKRGFCRRFLQDIPTRGVSVFAGRECWLCNRLGYPSCLQTDILGSPNILQYQILFNRKSPETMRFPGL